MQFPRGTRKAPIVLSNLLAHALSVDQRSDAEHFPHTGSAAWTFVLNHNDGPGFDTPSGDRASTRFFVFEDFSSATKVRVLRPAT